MNITKQQEYNIQNAFLAEYLSRGLEAKWILKQIDNNSSEYQMFRKGYLANIELQEYKKEIKETLQKTQNLLGQIDEAEKLSKAPYWKSVWKETLNDIKKALKA